MPVFDNPGRELQRLQEELLAQEEELEALEDLEEEDFFEGEYEEPPLIRNYANRYGADIRNFANGYRGEALFDPEDEEYDEEPDYEEDPYALYPERRGFRLFRRKKQKEDALPVKGTRGLKLVLILEIIGILGILIWWAVMVW